VADQVTQVNEVFLGSLALARGDALPFADEVLGGKGHGVFGSIFFVCLR
jgi:hypothetical protein